MTIHLRKARHADIPFMQEMLYEAVFWRDRDNKPTLEEGLGDPDVRKSLANWGERDGDLAVVATVDATQVGAAWVRRWAEDNHIRGYLDDDTPVLAIGVHHDYRHRGIGGKLIEWLIDYASKNAIQQISLMVSKDNYAINLYHQQGFLEVADTGNSLLMVRKTARQPTSTDRRREITMESTNLTALPAPLTWLDEPTTVETGGENDLAIAAGPMSDWFYDPSSDKKTSNAPIALFTPPDEHCTLSARVTVGFESTFDAGVLFVYAENERWAKLCFEYSPDDEPMIVSVVTRGRSDDCNSVVIDGNTVYLRLNLRGDALAFHYSLDGEYWQLVRHFTIGSLADAKIGFAAQSPTGEGCSVQFAEIDYQSRQIEDIRSGE